MTLPATSPIHAAHQELHRYLELVWRALSTPDPDMAPLREALRPICVVVQVFDTLGSAHARICVDEAGFSIEPGEPVAQGAAWVLSRRHVADVVRRPQHYLAHPARLDLGWLQA